MLARCEAHEPGSVACDAGGGGGGGRRLQRRRVPRRRRRRGGHGAGQRARGQSAQARRAAALERLHAGARQRQRGGRPSAPTTAGALGPCSVQPAGACIARSCPLGDGGMPAVARTNVDAGTVTLTGPKGAMPLVAGGQRRLQRRPRQRTSRGRAARSFTMTVTGGVAPAFTVALVAPSRPRMLTPTRPASGAPPLAVTRASGLGVTWTPTSPGTMTIDVEALTDTARSYLLCDAPTSAGSYTLATDALAAMPSTAKMIAMFARASATATATARRLADHRSPRSTPSSGFRQQRLARCR